VGCEQESRGCAEAELPVEAAAFVERLPCWRAHR